MQSSSNSGEKIPVALAKKLIKILRKQQVDGTDDVITTSMVAHNGADLPSTAQQQPGRRSTKRRLEKKDEEEGAHQQIITSQHVPRQHNVDGTLAALGPSRPKKRRRIGEAPKATNQHREYEPVVKDLPQQTPGYAFGTSGQRSVTQERSAALPSNADSLPMVHPRLATRIVHFYKSHTEQFSSLPATLRNLFRPNEPTFSLIQYLILWHKGMYGFQRRESDSGKSTDNRSEAAKEKQEAHLALLDDNLHQFCEQLNTSEDLPTEISLLVIDQLGDDKPSIQWSRLSSLFSLFLISPEECRSIFLPLLLRFEQVCIIQSADDLKVCNKIAQKCLEIAAPLEMFPSRLVAKGLLHCLQSYEGNSVLSYFQIHITYLLQLPLAKLSDTLKDVGKAWKLDGAIQLKIADVVQSLRPGLQQDFIMLSTLSMLRVLAQLLTDSQQSDLQNEIDSKSAALIHSAKLEVQRTLAAWNQSAVKSHFPLDLENNLKLKYLLRSINLSDRMSALRLIKPLLAAYTRHVVTTHEATKLKDNEILEKQREELNRNSLNEVQIFAGGDSVEDAEIVLARHFDVASKESKSGPTDHSLQQLMMRFEGANPQGKADEIKRSLRTQRAVNEPYRITVYTKASGSGKSHILNNLALYDIKDQTGKESKNTKYLSIPVQPERLRALGTENDAETVASTTIMTHLLAVDSYIDNCRQDGVQPDPALVQQLFQNGCGDFLDKLGKQLLITSPRAELLIEYGIAFREQLKSCFDDYWFTVDESKELIKQFENKVDRLDKRSVKGNMLTMMCRLFRRVANSFLTGTYFSAEHIEQFISAVGKDFIWKEENVPDATLDDLKLIVDGHFQIRRQNDQRTGLSDFVPSLASILGRIRGSERFMKEFCHPSNNHNDIYDRTNQALLRVAQVFEVDIARDLSPLIEEKGLPLKEILAQFIYKGYASIRADADHVTKLSQGISMTTSTGRYSSKKSGFVHQQPSEICVNLCIWNMAFCKIPNTPYDNHIITRKFVLKEYERWTASLVDVKPKVEPGPSSSATQHDDTGAPLETFSALFMAACDVNTLFSAFGPEFAYRCNVASAMHELSASSFDSVDGIKRSLLFQLLNLHRSGSAKFPEMLTYLLLYPHQFAGPDALCMLQNILKATLPPMPCSISCSLVAVDQHSMTVLAKLADMVRKANLKTLFSAKETAKASYEEVVGHLPFMSNGDVSEFMSIIVAPCDIHSLGDIVRELRKTEEVQFRPVGCGKDNFGVITGSGYKNYIILLNDKNGLFKDIIQEEKVLANVWKAFVACGNKLRRPNATFQQLHKVEQSVANAASEQVASKQSKKSQKKKVRSQRKLHNKIAGQNKSPKPAAITKHKLKE